MMTTLKFGRLATATAITLIAAGGAVAQTAASGEAGLDARAQTEAGIEMILARGEVEVQAGLMEQGYVIVETRRTLLGRILIRAENEVHVREVVVHPSTGEILRDVVVQVKANGSAGAEAAAQAGGASSGETSQADTGADIGVSAGGGASASVDTDSGVSIGGGTSGSISGGLSIGN